MSWENAEGRLGTDETGQYTIRWESYNLQNSGYFGYYNAYNDGSATTAA